jgi:hypothetical protein
VETEERLLWLLAGLVWRGLFRVTGAMKFSSFDARNGSMRLGHSWPPTCIGLLLAF